MGTKYIIEIEDDEFIQNEGNEILYRAKGFKSLVFDENGLDKLTPFATAATFSEAYQNGLNDAWDAAQRVVFSGDTWYMFPELDDDELEDDGGKSCILRIYSAREVMKRMADYDLKNSYFVGDVITDGKENYLIIGKNDMSYRAISGASFEPVSIGVDFISYYRNLNDRKDMNKFWNTPYRNDD